MPAPHIPFQLMLKSLWKALKLHGGRTRFDNLRGLTFGPEGALCVVEAGVGGDRAPRMDIGPTGVYCPGLTGAVTRIWKGQQGRIVTGLSSAARPDGGSAFGPHDISFQGKGGAYVTVGDCAAWGEAVSGGCGQLIRLKSQGRGWR